MATELKKNNKGQFLDDKCNKTWIECFISDDYWDLINISAYWSQVNDMTSVNMNIETAKSFHVKLGEEIKRLEIKIKTIKR